MYTGSKKNNLLFFLTLLFFSCVKEKNTSVAISLTQQKNDSISQYIASSQNKNLTPSEQKKMRFKALDSINALSHDSLKIKYLSPLSYTSITVGDSLFFRKVNNQTIALSKKIKDSVALAEAKWDLGIFLNDTQLKDSTYFYYNEALTIYSNLKNKSKIAYLLYSIGTVQTAIGDYSGAELNTVKAMEIFKPLDNNKGLHSCYNSLGNISNSLGEFKRAIEFYEKANSYLDTTKTNSYNHISIMNNIGVSHNFLGDFKKAERNFQKVIDSDSLKLKQPSFYAKALTNLADTKTSLKSEEDLKPLFLEAIAVQKNLNNLFNEATSTSHFARYLAYKMDTTNAIDHAKQARELALKSDNAESLLRTLNLLTLIDKKNASTHAQEYISFNTKLQEDERKLRDKFARIRFQTDEFIEKNELLASQNKLLTRETQLWSAVALIGFISALAILIIVVQRIKNKDLKFKEQQQESNQEIFNLLMTQRGKLEEGKKLEQERISQELHDGVLNRMLGIRLVLIGLNKRSDQESIDQRALLIKELAELSEEIRTVSHELNNAAYQKIQNFIESTKALLETFRTATNHINYHFKYNEEIDWDNLNGDIKINLYRILQESIQNCIKHAEATSIFINFDVNEKEIIAIIEDNGIGFDAKKIKKGIGVRNISSRLKKLKGDWNIESTIGSGTTMTIRIPYNTIEKGNAA
tara:strand:+ start:4379 stop:6463 length:2085 start_codon:yes stop_codon:yes gene_type:complete